MSDKGILWRRKERETIGKLFILYFGRKMGKNRRGKRELFKMQAWSFERKYGRNVDAGHGGE